MSRLSRAQFLTVVGSALPGWALSHSLAAFQTSAADRRRRVGDFISTYDGQGIHRTATIVDNASADWLRQLATVAGAEARLVPFALQQVEVRAAYLEADGRRIDGVPFFDAGFTGETGIVGTLGPAGANADIALVTLDAAAISSEGQSIDRFDAASRIARSWPSPPEHRRGWRCRMPSPSGHRTAFRCCRSHRSTNQP